jgi:hypothetical protein
MLTGKHLDFKDPKLNLRYFIEPKRIVKMILKSLKIR